MAPHRPDRLAGVGLRHGNPCGLPAAGRHRLSGGTRFRALGTSLKTTNAIESIHARVESRTAKVDHWKNSDQKQRWLATALLDLEPRLRRIKNYHALPQLRDALRRYVGDVKQPAA